MSATPTAAELETNALFTQYLNVVNRAIGENRDRFPYRQMLSMGERILGDKQIGVAIYKDDPSEPHDWFTIAYGDGTFEIVEHGKKAPKISWRVKQSHLEKVVADPEPFVESPIRLDLDWLRTRFSMRSTETPAS